LETYRAARRIKAGKAPGAYGIYLEYIRHGGHTALTALNELFIQVWEEEAVPDEWRQGIIIPLYKGKGSRSECSNYRGITLLSASGKVFAHLILARIKPTLVSHRHMQYSGFTPRRSTCDRILTLCNIVQRHQIYGRSAYAAYFDLHVAFDSISHPALWLLLKRAGVPEKIVTQITALYNKLVSCFCAIGLQSTWIEIMSGVRM